MTILSRIEKPGFELTVCGTPNKQWLDWLLTTDKPLTANQIYWRELHRDTVRRFPDLGTDTDDDESTQDGA
ncbi:hypothetical protein [Allokutzneria sp. A3M-2-11 16]|uniref:hypothetical protein n=1 Tax=Allokutzneria sp. A3M-2-11 16 TaxID=2962043 RepID=UPI0020B6D075|nr:hypothetical protein [Allokutzneria sp. A3M-2-11 16]